MAVNKPVPRPQQAPVQARRPVQSQPVPTAPGKVRVGGTIGERRAQTAQPQVAPNATPKAVARNVMAHKAQAFSKPNANYVAGRLENPLNKITKSAPSIGPGRITTAGALGILDHYFPSTKKTA